VSTAEIEDFLGLLLTIFVDLDDWKGIVGGHGTEPEVVVDYFFDVSECLDFMSGDLRT
jgi:hypothetical protein